MIMLCSSRVRSRENAIKISVTCHDIIKLSKCCLLSSLPIGKLINVKVSIDDYNSYLGLQIANFTEFDLAVDLERVVRIYIKIFDSLPMLLLISEKNCSVCQSC